MDPSQSFPTFTTSRPRASRGHRPAGLQACDEDTIRRWEADSHRFPPCQYTRKQEYRIPSIAEREFMMGLPVGYSQMCMVGVQGQAPQPYWEWMVSPSGCMVAGAARRTSGLRPCCATLKEVINRLKLEGDPYIQSRLMRPPLRIDHAASSIPEQALIQQLAGLVSTKGADLMLSSTPEEIQDHQRLRRTVNPKMWRWKVISGWKWLGSREHINSLELRACLACIRWRLEHLRNHDCRILHLTDSLVCLHSMTRGRTSSRRLRRTLCRIDSLLLAHNVIGLWGYVSTDLNPADRPSRWAVRTKFRRAKGRL